MFTETYLSILSYYLNTYNHFSYIHRLPPRHNKKARAFYRSMLRYTHDDVKFAYNHSSYIHRSALTLYTRFDEGIESSKIVTQG